MCRYEPQVVMVELCKHRLEVLKSRVEPAETMADTVVVCSLTLLVTTDLIRNSHL